MTNPQLPATMWAMVLEAPRTELVHKTVSVPRPSSQQVLIKVIACGVCRTDLHIVDGELSQAKLPLIPGHEIVGRIVETGTEVTQLNVGEYVGVPWLGYTCGSCSYCLKNQENLCERAGFTGYTLDGGFAEYTVAHQQYCFTLTEKQANPTTAPLLCAGLIGYRSYSMISKDAKTLGIYGFGAAAHIMIQLASFQQRKVVAFTKEGDTAAQEFAQKLGAVWAGDSTQVSPHKLDAAIIFAPVGNLIPLALEAVDKGGTVICGGIHMSDIPSFPYRLLWGERSIRSVANLTRSDGIAFLSLAFRIPVHTEIQLFPLHKANDALRKLREGTIRGAAVLAIDSSL